MQALPALSKGGNAALEPQEVALHVASPGTPVDVSALLLGSGGRVRSDDDLVFHGHPAQDGVRLTGSTVVADLPGIPADVATVVVVASVDQDRPGAVFTTSPVLTAVQGDSGGLTFTPPDFAAGETVVVLAELYRRAGGWRVRAVGQGYASGLAGLATDYGVDVEPQPVAVPRQLPRPGGAASVEVQAPALLAATRQASEALARAGAAGRRAAVYLVLDHDWAMEELYESFAVQAFTERVLALSVSLDDDGVVPVIFSSGNEPTMEEIRLDNYPGRINQLHTQLAWGWGNVAAAMRVAAHHYQESGAGDPAFVIVQVGAEPWDKPEFRALLQHTADSGIFWLFVGFGHGRLAFFNNLNASAAGSFGHVAFFEASKNPGAVPEAEFYPGLVEAFVRWASR
jgi:stress response protein SCP2